MINDIKENMYFHVLETSTNHWNVYFFNQAKLAAGESKDPSTKVGASIANKKNTTVSTGYNGLPMGRTDDEDILSNRELKYKLIIHAEVNAILFAQQPLDGFKLYTYPFPVCSNCSSIVIQSGIKTVASPYPTPEQEARWGESMKLAIENFVNSKVAVFLVKRPFEISKESHAIIKSF